MDYQDTVEWLKSYKKKFERMAELRSRMTGVKAISYEEKIGSKKTINDYLDEITKLSNELARIENAIDNIKDHYPRLILAYKYLQYKSFEEIAELINYSISQIKRFHSIGINEIMNRNGLE